MNENTEKDIREIKYKVDAIEKSVDLLVRANRKPILDDLLSFFGKSNERVKVFLAVDGEKSVSQIAQQLTLRPQNASRRISELEREGLITVKTTSGPTKIYAKTEKVRLLGLERQLEQRLLGQGSQQPSGSEDSAELATPLPSGEVEQHVASRSEDQGQD